MAGETGPLKLDPRLRFSRACFQGGLFVDKFKALASASITGDVLSPALSLSQSPSLGGEKESRSREEKKISPSLFKKET